MQVRWPIQDSVQNTTVQITRIHHDKTNGIRRQATQSFNLTKGDEKLHVVHIACLAEEQVHPNGEQEDGNEGEEEQSMDNNGDAARLEVTKFNKSVASWHLE